MQMLDRQRVQQASADEAKKLVDAAALAAERQPNNPPETTPPPSGGPFAVGSLVVVTPRRGYWVVCVPLFYVIDTGSTGSRGLIRTWGLPVYPPPLLRRWLLR